jgi:hypothetical protein
MEAPFGRRTLQEEGWSSRWNCHSSGPSISRPQRLKVTLKANEIVIAWQWNDGTRCVLCDVGGDRLDLRVVRDGQVLKRQPVVDVALALGITAREMELELSSKQTQPDRVIGPHLTSPMVTEP